MDNNIVSKIRKIRKIRYINYIKAHLYDDFIDEFYLTLLNDNFLIKLKNWLCRKYSNIEWDIECDNPITYISINFEDINVVINFKM